MMPRLPEREQDLVRGVLDALEMPTCAVGSTGDILFVNRAWLRAGHSGTGMSGLAANYLAACDAVPPDSPDFPDAQDVARGLRRVLSGTLARHHSEYSTPGPALRSCYEVRITPASFGGTSGAAIMHVDVTAAHQVKQQLDHQVLHDALTGLANRVLLYNRLEHACAESARRQGELAVGFLDLDDFKRINDELGHAAGDDLLQQLAARLQSQLRGGDTLARYAGDEFVLLWPGLSGQPAAVQLGDRLREALAAPFLLGTTWLTVTASLGIAMATASSEPDELLRRADAAMYRAKSLGPGQQLLLVEPPGDQRSALSAGTGLTRALATSELAVYYQPVVGLRTGRPTAVEASVRWEHPERGTVGPDLFMPLAERNGLVHPLGRWVLQQACADAASFDGPAADLDVAINVSPLQLPDPGFIGDVREALQRSGLAPERLILEVTESATLTEPHAAALALEELARLGVRIALDDFGTGYSSLAHVRRLPISTIKIGKMFVAGLGTQSQDRAICHSIVRLAAAVGADCIAEGVESAAQRQALIGLGCPYGQGPLWTPAVPLHELETTLLTVFNREVAGPVPPRR